MHRSVFISAGEFGQPLDSSVIARMFNCIQGDLDGFIAALEKAEFECRLPALSSLWADVRHENAQEILHNQLRVDGMYIQFPEYVSLPKGATVFALEAFLLLSNMELSLLTRVNCGSRRIIALSILGD